MKTMDQRYKAIDRWCRKRGIRQEYMYFRNCDPDIEQHYNRIRMVFTSGKPVMDTDEPWIRSMETTIAAITNRKQVAA